MVISSILITAPPAYSAPRPRAEEWWFGTWDIQDKVWPISTGRGVTVALLDSGVNAKLPDLRDAVLPGADIDAGKGDARTDSDDEENGHGTAMAALIAGRGTGTGMVGVAPEAKILPIRAQGGNAEIVEGIKYAVNHGAKVINISQGAPSPEWLGCDVITEKAVTYALDRDVIVVASAGNDGHEFNSPEYPALCPGILTVGAVDYLFKPWFKTQRQPYVAVAAPGVQTGSINRAGRFVPKWNGTSQAAALTSGVVALVRAKFPRMSGRELVQRIIASARDVGPSGRDDATGYGLVRPYHALVDKVAADAPNPVFSAWEKANAAATPTAPAVSPSQSGRSPQSAHSAKRSAVPAIFVGVGIVAVMVAIAIYAFIKRNNRRRVVR
ncbi:S8 family serine peptidase [Actinoallomurus sp. NPDC052274]|uniref:S8 family serine peptidase n=1 Tax=Actinoallomurus sp. NPDC052274 TaxID=3155420 RepID=UPI00341C0218